MAGIGELVVVHLNSNEGSALSLDRNASPGSNSLPLILATLSHRERVRTRKGRG